MVSTPEQLAPHMTRFLDMLDTAFRSFGADGLPDRFRHAVVATPRHLFVHRFRLGDGPLRSFGDGDPAADLADIYSDAVMIHVDSAGERLPSSNSQPSYVLWLLHLLDLQPGQRVLEVGSGSGWLAAIMARLVGPAGHVTGLELLPDLAAQSRADLAGLGVGNVSVMAVDGAEGYAAGAPYDRAMITAAVWDVPAALFEQVAEGGRLLAPIELKASGCHVAAMRRDRDGFVAEQAIPGWFVPLLGPGQRRPVLRRPLESLSIWPEVGGIPSVRVPLPLGTVSNGDFPGAAVAFRAFLGRVAPGFILLGEGDPPWPRPARLAVPFGIVDEARRSVACWRAGTLFGYGGPSAVQVVADAYARWASLGMPGLTGMALTVRRSADLAADAAGWREDRGDSALLWSAFSDSGSWRSLVSVPDIDAMLP